MPDRSDVQWFKTRFQARIEPAIAGTALTVDLLTAIACQETGEVWPLLRRRGLDEARLLELCVGDTLDADRGRRAFPRTRAALEAVPRGPEMFALAHQALLDMAAFVPAYRPAAARAHKFCRGFGLFQRDLQFFLEDPDYFLLKRYAHFEASLGHCVALLRAGLAKMGWQHRAVLEDRELCALGILYNTGRFRPERGLQQGYRNGAGQYYGELLFDYLRLAHTVAPGASPALPEPAQGEAIVPPPSPVTATGRTWRVDTRIATLRLRREPRISRPATANVIGELPDGHPVRAVTDREENGFLEVETSLAGALLRGYAHTDYLKPDPGAAPIPVVAPAGEPPAGGIPAIHLPRPAGRITRRRDPADAHSLNEPGWPGDPLPPGRRGADAGQLRDELAAIVRWLDVEKPSHKRYQPTATQTFCNIYAHDYCHFAGVYLPRVWWTPRALLALQAGDEVASLIGATVTEMRANDLFRWLRDFGPDFGWRQTGTLDKLQDAANQGAVALLVARRKVEGRSGHIVPVVPETGEHLARRDAAGAVVSPLQSQAGASNFRYGHGRSGWWRDEKFAEFAFWIHA
jgi:hypothetical protein